MREISSTDINRQLTHMAAQGYAYKSIAGQKSVLSLIWQYWCAEMHGDTNPCTLLKLPQGLPQKKRRAPTDQEVADVKAHPDGFGLCPAIMMYAACAWVRSWRSRKRTLPTARSKSVNRWFGTTTTRKLRI
jgi:hypothetical protein